MISGDTNDGLHQNLAELRMGKSDKLFTFDVTSAFKCTFYIKSMLLLVLNRSNYFARDIQENRNITSSSTVKGWNLVGKSDGSEIFRIRATR